VNPPPGTPALPLRTAAVATTPGSSASEPIAWSAPPGIATSFSNGGTPALAGGVIRRRSDTTFAPGARTLSGACAVGHETAAPMASCTRYTPGCVAENEIAEPSTCAGWCATAPPSNVTDQV
jgi:hypothetical protein